MLSVVNGLSKTDYTYNSRGLRTSTKNYYEGSLITQTDYTYNLAGLATSLVNKNAEGDVLSSFSYTYQFDGNVSSETDHNGIVTNYTYDLLGRLIAEVSGASSKYYTYDNSGNRTKVIVDGVSQVLYTYNDKGQLVTETKTNGETSEVISYTYDANGNLISKAEGIKTTDYIYDTFGRMVAADGSTYTYRPDGLRASKTVDNHSQRFSYVNGKVVNDGNKKYTYGLELIKSNTAYFLYNIHGDVIQMVNPSGALLKTYNYDAYGNELTRDLDDTNPFRYCGEYYDTETGFIYLRARYYDPMVGRFTTVDPAKDGLNWYTYCNDNPVAFVDPLGLSADNAIGSSRYRTLNIDSQIAKSKKEYEIYYTSKAYKKVENNIENILIYSDYYDVDPNIVASVIFVEQYFNYNWVDVCTDWVAFYGILDTSIGIGQVKMSTAKYLEENGYVPRTLAKEVGWNIPLIGTIHGTETMAREKRLEDDKYNIMYVAAYIRSFVDDWSAAYPSIANSPEILGTLFNLGNRTPHNSPKPNWFGEQVGCFYGLMEEMLF